MIEGEGSILWEIVSETAVIGIEVIKPSIQISKRYQIDWSQLVIIDYRLKMKKLIFDIKPIEYKKSLSV